MRRHRFWVAWTLGPLLVTLIVLTVVSAATGFTSWPPLLGATVAAAAAGSFVFFSGSRAARDQERARQSESARRNR
ncbi:hypothetical protein [Curtobacterium sp. L1-20]|uniref:hypothetical protein n=1 Tax=Curtobacterium sp. L1-20 TaxID=3138181 RepID=UPI003B52F992